MRAPIFPQRACLSPARIELSYFSIASELSADIDAVGVVSMTMLLNRFLNVPCRPSEYHKCPAIVDPPAR